MVAAASCGSVPLLAYLHSLHADANAFADKDGGATPLQIATNNGHLAAARWLLDVARVDVNLAHPRTHFTALHLAAEGGYADLLAALLAAGSDASLRTHLNDNALHLAVSSGSLACVSLLLGRGMSMTEQGQFGMTPLHMACRLPLPGVLALCLAQGADASARAAEGVTPLHIAMVHSNHLIASFLLKAGADVRARDALGNTALRSLCSQLNQDDVGSDLGKVLRTVQVFCEGGGEVNAPAKNGSAALHSAMKWRDPGVPELVGLLLHYGADPDMRDGNGYDAIGVAKAVGNTLAEAALLEARGELRRLRTETEEEESDGRQYGARMPLASSVNDE